MMNIVSNKESKEKEDKKGLAVNQLVASP